MSTKTGRSQRARQRERALLPSQVTSGPTGETPALAPTGGHRLLVLGDTAGTGFGTVTRDLCRALVIRGVDVRILSANEDANTHSDPHWPMELRPRTVALGSVHGWAAINGPEAAVLVQRAMGVFTGATIPGWVPETVLIIGDHASAEQSPWPKMLPPSLPAFIYIPVEGVDLPPSWAKMWDRVKPVAMTNFGADEIEKILGERPPVVYHGIDPEGFWQVSAGRPITIRTDKAVKILRSKQDCRSFLGWPLGATILFRADRLMPRKAFPAMFRALAPVLARHPETVLYLHCRSVDQGGSLWHETSKYPEFIRQRMGVTGFHDKFGGVPRELLNVMYNAADVYISTCAEGFGLTVAEALACGTPAVALHYSSLPEVVGPAGLLVGDVALVDNIYSYFWAIPKGDAYTEAVERIVTDRELRVALGMKGPGHIAQFSWATAAEQFEAIFSGAEVPAPRPVPATQRLAQLGLVRGSA